MSGRLPTAPDSELSCSVTLRGPIGREGGARMGVFALGVGGEPSTGVKQGSVFGPFQSISLHFSVSVS